MAARELATWTDWQFNGRSISIRRVPVEVLRRVAAGEQRDPGDTEPPTEGHIAARARALVMPVGAKLPLGFARGRPRWVWAGHLEDVRIEVADSATSEREGET